MAKYRRGRKSSKCPEPFNTLIDLAGGLAMGAVASHMEKKYHYRAKGKINPYTVSAYGIASGRMKSTKNILRTGAMLGAMGSFDVEEDSRSRRRSFVFDDPIFDEIPETKVNDNRYAWRMNCEDGSAYGVSPRDYETRARYNEALRRAKGDEKKAPQPCQDQEDDFPGASEKHMYIRVSRLDNGDNRFYRSRDWRVKIGDTVVVPTENGHVEGIVIAISFCTDVDAPQSPEETEWIIE